MNKTTIKNDIKTRLTGKTLAGTNISVDKILPQQMAALPAIAIYAPNMSIENRQPDDTGAFLVSTMNIVLDLIVSQAANYSSDLDTLEQEIIDILMTDSAFITQFDEFISIDINTTLDNEGEFPTATSEITMSVLTTDSYNAI